MVFEKDFLSLLQEKLQDIPIYYQMAPQGTKEPFGVLQTITTSGAIEVGVQKPWMQLDIYTKTQFGAVETAEKALDAIQFYCGRRGETLFESIVAERKSLIKCEDGTWKVPLDIRFYCRRIQ